MGLSIDNGSTTFNFMDEEILRNCENFHPDLIDIPSDERSSHRRRSIKRRL